MYIWTYIAPNWMKLVGLVRKWTEVSLVPVPEAEVKTVTRGIQYKFTILNSPKINTLWENCHHFLLAYQNLTKHTNLERGYPRLPKVSFSNLEGHKFQSYISWKVGQQNSLPIRVFQRWVFFNSAHILTRKSIWEFFHLVLHS